MIYIILKIYYKEKNSEKRGFHLKKILKKTINEE